MSAVLSRREFGAVVGAAGLTAFLAGCAPTPGSTPSGGTPTGKVRIVWWGSDERTKATNEALRFIEKQHPGLTITGEGMGWDGYFEKFATELAGHAGPDIVQQNLIGPLQQFGRQGALLPLDQHFGKELNIEGYQKFIEYGRVGGKATYGIPLTQTAFAAIYNPETLTGLGVPEPSFGWNWSDFEEICTKIVKASQGRVAGSVDASFDPENYEIWHYGRTGNNLYDDQGQRQDTPALLTEWFDMWAQFRAKKLIVAPDVQAVFSLGDTATSPMATGKAAIGFDYSTTFPTYAPIVGSVPRMAPSPSSGSHPNGFISPTSLWSITSDSQNIEASLLVVDQLINNPEIFSILGMTRGLPIHPEAIKIILPDLDESGKEIVNFIGKLQETELRILQSDVPAGVPDLLDLYMRVAQEVAFGKSTPAVGAESFFDQAARFL